jgi:1,4-dihydroxy-2-naphthoyl-CoA hydrolase
MSFTYSRTIRLADTDAAGVVYFARTLSLCHEAYEHALEQAGVILADLLGGKDVIVPISKSEAEYLRPLRAGDKVRIELTAELLTAESFAVRYDVFRLGKPDKLCARVRTEHVCSSLAKRERVAIPTALARWVKEGKVTNQTFDS